MDTLLTNLETIAPTFFAIMAVVMFTRRTRWLCYATVILAIGAELIPVPINITAFSACCACLVALLFSEILRTWNITHPFFSR